VQFITKLLYHHLHLCSPDTVLCTRPMTPAHEDCAWLTLIVLSYICGRLSSCQDHNSGKVW